MPMKIRPPSELRTPSRYRRPPGRRWRARFTIPWPRHRSSGLPPRVLVPVGKFPGLYEELEQRAQKAGMGLQDYVLITVLAGHGHELPSLGGQP